MAPTDTTQTAQTLTRADMAYIIVALRTTTQAGYLPAAATLLNRFNDLFDLDNYTTEQTTDVELSSRDWDVICQSLQTLRQQTQRQLQQPNTDYDNRAHPHHVAATKQLTTRIRRSN